MFNFFKSKSKRLFLLKAIILKTFMFIILKDLIQNYKLLLLNLTSQNYNASDLILKHSLSPFYDQYISQPISEFILNDFFFINLYQKNNTNVDYSRFKLRADLLTLSSILISIPSIWLLASDDSNYRRIACITFQLKNIIDYIDGPLARMDASNRSSFIAIFGNKKFNYGHLFDSLSQSLPTIFFIIGSFRFIKIKLKEYFMITNTSQVEVVEIKKRIYSYSAIFLFNIILSGVLWNMVFNKYKKKFLFNYTLNFLDYLNIMLCRYSSGLFIQDLFCVFVFFKYDWVSSFNFLLIK
jgi:hypothetical protein